MFCPEENKQLSGSAAKQESAVTIRMDAPHTTAVWQRTRHAVELHLQRVAAMFSSGFLSADQSLVLVQFF